MYMEPGDRTEPLLVSMYPKVYQSRRCWFRPGAQRLLIIISGTEGLMGGIDSQYMGDYGMAGLNLPKLYV